MCPDTKTPALPGVVTINRSWDTTVKVTDAYNSEVTFQVKRSNLESHSNYFKKLLDPMSPWAGKGGNRTNIFHLEEDTGATTLSVGLLFFCINGHENEEDKLDFPIKDLQIPIDEIWRLLTLVDVQGTKHRHAGKYQVSADFLTAWFERWFRSYEDHLDEQTDYESLLYPAYVLDDARTRGRSKTHIGPFGRITKWLVYHGVGQLQEDSPFRDSSYFQGMHMPSDVISQLRKARSHLRLEVTNSIEAIRAALVSKDHRCGNQVEAFANLMRALRATHVYPVQDATGKAFVDIAKQLLVLHYELPQEGCKTCQTPDEIARIVMKQMKKMDGLCLRCMQASVSGGGSYSADPSYERLKPIETRESRPCGWHGWGTWRFSNFTHSDDETANDRCRRERFKRRG